MNVQARKFGLFELFALAGQQMHMQPAGGTTFAADHLQTETLRKFCGGFFSNLQIERVALGNPKAEFGKPKEIRMTNDRNPKNSLQEGIYGKAEN